MSGDPTITESCGCGGSHLKPCDWCGAKAVAIVNDKSACELHLDNAFKEAVPAGLADLILKERRSE